MVHNHYKKIFLLLLLVLLMISYCEKKQKPSTLPMDDQTGEYTSSDEKKAEGNNYFYIIPSSYWPKIKIGKSFSAIIIFVALLFGVVMYIIGQFAGGKLNRSKILASIIVATAVGFIARSVLICVQVFLTKGLASVIGNEMVAATIIDFFLYTIWIAFIAGIAVYFYETIVVTAKEAFPQRQG
jgi:hypothetical protein